MTEAIRQDSSRTATRREHVPLGILYMIGATSVFAMSSATSKWLVDIYPVGEVLFTRSGLSLIVKKRAPLTCPWVGHVGHNGRTPCSG